MMALPNSRASVVRPNPDKRSYFRNVRFEPTMSDFHIPTIHAESSPGGNIHLRQILAMFLLIRPIDDIDQFPRILIEIKGQLVVLVKPQLRCGVKHARTHVLVFVI